MLEYKRIDVSEGIDFSRIKWKQGSRECSICHYCYFLKVNFRFQAIVCDGCHDLIQKAMNFGIAVAYENYLGIHFLHE